MRRIDKSNGCHFCSINGCTNCSTVAGQCGTTTTGKLYKKQIRELRGNYEKRLIKLKDFD